MKHDPDSTRDRIMDAAVSAFSCDGLAGARVDAIAKAAGCNKQLIYHYFGSKAGLFEAVLMRVLAKRAPKHVTSATGLCAALLERFEELEQHPEWVRILEWEALHTDGGPIAAEAMRRQVLDQAVTELAAKLGDGDDALPARELLLAFTGMLMIPWLLPQHTRLLTGGGTDDPGFRSAYARTLERIMQRLVPQGDG